MKAKSRKTLLEDQNDELIEVSHTYIVIESSTVPKQSMVLGLHEEDAIMLLKAQG